MESDNFMTHQYATMLYFLDNKTNTDTSNVCFSEELRCNLKNTGWMGSENYVVCRSSSSWNMMLTKSFTLSLSGKMRSLCQIIILIVPSSRDW